MNVTATATQAFVHSPYELVKGQKQEMPSSVAKDLAAAGLVTYDDGQQARPSVDQQPAADQKSDVEYANKADSKPANKAAAKPVNK